MLDAPTLTVGTRGHIWIHSDLQLADPARAREVFTAAIDDLLGLELDVGAAWCLGDALCGRDEAALDAVADACIEQLDRLGVPVCYVLGNHELDLRNSGTPRYPLYERAKAHPRWHTMDSISDFHFARTCFGTPVVFLGDHVAQDESWWVQHGELEGDATAYPHGAGAYAALREAIAAHAGPVVTAGHQAYPGGQRPSPLLAQLLPLPENVRAHVYGHAHIGDHIHNKQRPYQRDNPIDGQPLRQFNISALETRRTEGSHSAILEFGPDGPTTLRIRCHLEKRWTETFELAQSTTAP